MAKLKTKPIIGIMIAELIEIIKSELIYDKVDMLSCLEMLYLSDGQNNNALIIEVIALTADLSRELTLQIPENNIKDILLTRISSLLSLTTIENKLKNFHIIEICLNLLKENIISLYSLNYKLIIDTLFNLIQFTNFDYSDFNFSEIILYTEKNIECNNCLINLIKSFVKYEIFDKILEEQQDLLRKLRKTASLEIIKKLLIIAYLFHPVYIESSMHILNELIFLNFSDPKLQIISKLLYLSFTQRLFEEDNSMSLLECIENILFVYSNDTKTQCNLLFGEICLVCQKDSIKELLFANEIAIKNSLLLKLKIFGIENIGSGMICFLKLSFSIDLVNDIIKESLYVYDTNYSLYTAIQIQYFLNFLLNLINLISEYQDKENKKLITANMIRNILMRIKPMLSLKSSLIDNRKIISECLEIFYKSIDIINAVPLEIDLLDHSPFAFEEEANVSIPDALAEISYEFFPAFIYCLKSMSDSNCLGISITLIDIFIKIAKYQQDFFETDGRFSKKIFPYLKIILRSSNYSTPFHIKIKIKIIEIICAMSMLCIKPIIMDIKDCYNQLLLNNIEEIREKSISIKEIILSISN